MKKKNILFHAQIGKQVEKFVHLIYTWPVRESPRLKLPFFIIIAFIIQISIMLTVFIEYPSISENRVSDSGTVSVLRNNSLISKKIKYWLSENDPALFSPFYSIYRVMPNLPSAKYLPSYAEFPPPLRLFPKKTTDDI